MRRYSLSDFAQVPLVEVKTGQTQAPLDDVLDLASFGADVKWPDALVEIYEAGTPSDRSTALMEAAYLAAESKWTDPQIMSLIHTLDTHWKKYTQRPAKVRQKLLQDILERARVRVGYEGIDAEAPEGFFERKASQIVEESEILGFNDFLAKEYPIDWIFEGLLSKAGIGLITGWPGAGKTTLSLQMAGCAALGDDFLKWKCEKQSKVLYLSLEMAAPPLHLFVSSAKENYTVSELDELNQNLLLAPLGVPLHVDRKEGYEQLKKYLDKHQPDIVFVDSLSMITPKDLTDEEAIKTLFDGLAVIRQEHEVSFVIIHHNRKKAADAQRTKAVELSDIYGSTYITAKSDFAVNVTKLEEPNTIQFATLKNRLGEEPDAFDLIRKNMQFTDPSAMSGFFEGM